ncbi:hypothetical protein E2542_SST14636 [Spatholobus suberectus]|nr:hypothetical protein E2542_SST14636 [Spatholobus suberectus]
MRTIGKEGDAPLILGTRGGLVKARRGLQSAICLAISRVVLRGLVVVMMPPRDITARHTTGNWMELGDRMRTTLPFRIPMSDSDAATPSTARHSCLYVTWRPVAASMKAVVPRWAREEMKVVTSKELLGGTGRRLRLL